MDVMQLLEFNTQLTISNGRHSSLHELQLSVRVLTRPSILFLYETV